MLNWSELPVGNYRIVCPACGTGPRKKDMGVTILSAEYGVAHCFKCGFVENNRNTRQLTLAERKAFALRMDAIRRQHRSEQRARHAEVATLAHKRWGAAKPVLKHDYLTRKNVLPHGLKVFGNALQVPLRDANGVLHNLQSILPKPTAKGNDKFFLPGGRVKGLYFSIGRVSGKVLICEGLATGLTLHEQTHQAVAVAFHSGNLIHVAKALRAKFPCIDILLCADDDWKTAGNPGVKAAAEAAVAVGGLLAVPDFSGLERGERDTDFNDLHRLVGKLEFPQ